MPSAYNLTDIQEKEIIAVIRAGYYSNRSEVVRDAIRTFFEARPALRRAAAIEIYRSGEFTLSKCAEIAGLTTIEFKEVLKDRGIKVRTIMESKDSIKKGTEVLKRKRRKGKRS
jgi:predicted HTH domain antitoxin